MKKENCFVFLNHAMYSNLLKSPSSCFWLPLQIKYFLLLFKNVTK